MAPIELPSIPLLWWGQFDDPPGYYAEVIEGELVLTAMPNQRRHQRALLRLGFALSDTCPPDYEVLAHMQWPFETSGRMVTAAGRPDLVVAARNEGPIVTPPLLAVEILSAADDQTLLSGITRFDAKVVDYRRSGLEYLMVVQPDLPTVFLMRGDGSRSWTEVVRAQGDELFTTIAPFPFAVRPSELVNFG